MSSASVSIPSMDALCGRRVKTKSPACRFESGRGRHNPLARLDPQRVWQRSSLWRPLRVLNDAPTGDAAVRQVAHGFVDLLERVTLRDERVAQPSTSRLKKQRTSRKYRCLVSGAR